MNLAFDLHLPALRAVVVTAALCAAPVMALRGVVIDAETGLPIEGAYVSGRSAGATSAADGVFDLHVSQDDSISVSHVGYVDVTLAAGQDSITVRLVPAVLSTEPVVVSGLREAALQDAASSVTVIDRARLQAAANHHFQDLASAIPNLNWAGGTSRPRYFQIRGVGERSQFAGEGAPNYSVGFLMDDVDLSGLGSAGVLFDLQQLEVFKGPQSTVFGPNAMAGQINVRSADPEPEFGQLAQFTLGSDELQQFAGAVNVPVVPSLSMRFGYQSVRSNGFRENAFLNRDDTNRRRESLVRAKMLYKRRDSVSLRATVFYADLDNGYDAWVPDNNEELITFADKPGKDKQETVGASLRSEFQLPDLDADLISITAYSKTDQIYSFDGDWGNDEFWLQEPYGFDPDVEGWNYDFFDETDRERVTVSQELRLLKNDVAGGSAAIGVYYKDLEESDEANGYLFSGSASVLNSTFEIGNFALYGQYSRQLRPKMTLTLNTRADRQDTGYRGLTNVGSQPIAIDNDQWLLGGKGALVFRARPDRTFYAALSRGYRPGGINQHPYLAAGNRPFDPEYMTSLEVGMYSTGDHSTTTLSLFHAWRSQQQLSLSQQQDPGDPNSFFYFTANATEGTSSGLELEHRHRPLPNLKLQGALGLLKTHVDAYTFPTEAGEIVRGDRSAAHAPEYNLRLGAEYELYTGVTGRLEVTAMDAFFYSDSHDQRSEAYRLLNGSLSYGRGTWRMALWGRNLLDERYAVRGFFFGLEPPLYDPTLYESYGDPRQWGISVATSM